MKPILLKTASIVNIITILIVTCSGLSSCSSTDEPIAPTKDNESGRGNPLAIGDEILNNSHAQGLLSFRNEMSEYVLEVGPDIDELRDAYLANDETLIRSLLQLSQTQVDSLDSILTYHRQGLINAFPELELCAEEIVMPDYEVSTNQFFDNFDYYMLPVVETTAEQVNEKTPSSTILATANEVNCQWGPFFATLVACAGTGPFIYWLCAYAAICGFCSGGWVEDACGRDIEIGGGGSCIGD